MKKTYIKPLTRVIDVDASEMIAQSSLRSGGSNSGTGINAAETKGRSLWDDDDW